MVVTGHSNDAIKGLFAVGGMGLSLLAGLLYARLARPATKGSAAIGGLAAGAICALLGILVSYLLGDVPASLLALGTLSSAVTGAIGGLVGQLTLGGSATVLPVLALTLAASSAFAQTAPLSPLGWSGWVRCDVTVRGPGYTDQQTHTWTMGGTPSVQGAFYVYPATWSVVGSGGLQRSQGNQSLVAQWATNAPSMSAPLAVFVRASDKRMFIQSRHAPLRAPRAIQGYQQVTIGGKAQTPGQIGLEAFEWMLPTIDVIAPAPGTTNATANGTSTKPTTGSVGPMQPEGSQGSAACTWRFGQGSTAPAPLPAVAAPPVPAAH